MRASLATLTAVLALSATGCLEPDHIELDPQSLTFTRRGDQVWVHAIFKDSKGKQFTKQPATWSSSNDKVATVDNKEKPGNVVAVGPGHATITVKGEGNLMAELSVDVVTVEKLSVEPNPVKMTVDSERVAPKILALDVNGHLLKDRKAHIKCANEKICNSDGDGIWPAGDPGETTAEVAVDDKTVTVQVVVEGGKKKK
ncbi:MAG: Ig-like domain-containing protein [Deltaproteobacteria bacterium]|nr:Ig-like domain-containing protein [Deltaproteobacteria bacterium]